MVLPETADRVELQSDLLAVSLNNGGHRVQAVPVTRIGRLFRSRQIALMPT